MEGNRTVTDILDELQWRGLIAQHTDIDALREALNGLPAIYVPLPIGNGEQRLNAADVVAAGGGRLVEDALVTPDWVRSAVVPLLLDREATTDMARRAAAMGERHGDARLADLVRAAVR